MKNTLLSMKEKGLALLESLKTKLKNIHLGKKVLKILKRKSKPKLLFGLSLPISYWESRQPLIPYSSSPFLVDFWVPGLFSVMLYLYLTR